VIRGVRIFAVALATVSPLTCLAEPRPPSEGVIRIRFGVPPVQEPRQLWSRWHPLLDQLNTRGTRFRLQLESALTDPTYEERVQAGEFDVVLVEPHRVLEYETFGYRVFARVVAEDRIGGVVITRSDLPPAMPRWLAGKRIAFSSADALASAMLIRHWFREETGTDLTRVCPVLYAGSESSALRSLAVGDVDAAGVSRTEWDRFRVRYPHWSRILEARWYTETLSGPALMAHNRLGRDDIRDLRSALTRITENPAGREAISRTGYHGFRAAAGASYDDVWEFVNNYRRVFRRPPGRRGA
jgi:ABC-type phosphate/phosphonate transport system substrate-binding protein